MLHVQLTGPPQGLYHHRKKDRVRYLLYVEVVIWYCLGVIERDTCGNCVSHSRSFLLSPMLELECLPFFHRHVFGWRRLSVDHSFWILEVVFSSLLDRKLPWFWPCSSFVRRLCCFYEIFDSCSPSLRNILAQILYNCEAVRRTLLKSNRLIATNSRKILFVDMQGDHSIFLN